MFGYPDYSGQDTVSANPHEKRTVSFIDSTQRIFNGGRVASLPGTQKEVKMVTQLLAGNQVAVNEYMDRRATEAEIKAVDNPGILHIATHGFFLPDITMLHGQTFAGFDARKMKQNALLRSGLLLANSQLAINGVRTPDMEDGILTAFEAMNLNLDDTELVVLSACETGLGEIRNGEGVYGLQRAFQTAGAKSVLMSLWRVDDAATQELMTEFYKNWLGGDDKRTAFSKAQTTLRRKYKLPYYWGAFVLVGE